MLTCIANLWEENSAARRDMAAAQANAPEINKLGV